MLENLDRETIALAIGIGIAVGAGLFVALDSPLGFVAGLGIAIAIVVGRTRRNKRQDES